MKDKISFVLVAISSALIGSICCIGPIVSALIGIGAGASFAKFSSLRIPSMIIAIIALAFGFYVVYFKKHRVLCEDGECKVKTPGKLSKISLWIATILIPFLLIFPNIINTSSTNAKLSSETGLSSVVIEVQDMDCEACFIPIKNSLEEKDGIAWFSPDFSKQEIEVKFDQKKIKVSDITYLINESGFKVKNVKQKRDKK